MSSYDFVVVGAGISGAALAYFLKKGGAARVLLLERGELASGGTGKSAAIVRQHYSTRLMARLARRSVELFRAMSADLGADGGYRGVGYVFLGAADNADAAQKNVAMQQGVGIDTQWMAPPQVAAKFPWLNMQGVAGAAYEPLGGYADPMQAVEAYVAAFQRIGGEVRLRTSARKLLRDGARLTGVATDSETITAGTVVNAAGPWAPSLARLAGISLPMRSIREQDTVWEARPGRDLPECSVSNSIDAIYIRPQGERRYIVGRGFPKDYEDVDENNFKETPDDAFIADVQGRLEHRIPAMQGARLVHAYTALYDVSPDWYPFVGPRSDLGNYVDFSGGSGHGFKIAPGLAEELAGWLLTGNVAEDYKQLSHDRIAAKRLFVQSYGGNRG